MSTRRVYGDSQCTLVVDGDLQLAARHSQRRARNKGAAQHKVARARVHGIEAKQASSLRCAEFPIGAV